MYLSVYSRDHGNCRYTIWHQHCSWCLLHTGIPTECVSRYIPETMRTLPSVYFRYHRNSSLLNGIIHGVHYIQVYRWNLSVGIFQKPWKLFTSLCGDNKWSFDYSLFSQWNHWWNEKLSVIFEGAFWNSEILYFMN
jgi:hypothetical protein